MRDYSVIENIQKSDIRKKWRMTESYPQVTICTAWQALWNNETRNKLYEIRPNLKESLCNTTQPLYRKQETVMTRLATILSL